MRLMDCYHLVVGQRGYELLLRVRLLICPSLVVINYYVTYKIADVHYETQFERDDERWFTRGCD